jgi:hypothetical protein
MEIPKIAVVTWIKQYQLEDRDTEVLQWTFSWQTSKIRRSSDETKISGADLKMKNSDFQGIPGI